MDEKAESLRVNVGSPYCRQESFVFDDEIGVDELDNESCVSQGTRIYTIIARDNPPPPSQKSTKKFVCIFYFEKN